MLMVKVKELFFKKNNVIGYIFRNSFYFSPAKLVTAYLPNPKTIDLCSQNNCSSATFYSIANGTALTPGAFYFIIIQYNNSGFISPGDVCLSACAAADGTEVSIGTLVK